MGRLIPAFAQYFDGEGYPLANGWLQFLVSTTNNTPKTTYADPDYQIANENPLQLDAEGRCPNVFGTGDYRIISFVNDPEDEDSPGEQIQMFDPVTAQGTTAPSGGSGTVFDEWDVAVTYSIGDVVTWNLIYYRSLINSNLGLDPLIQEYAWERVDFIGWYNSTIFYELGDLVYYSDNLWLSLTSSNQGNTPNTSPSNWRRVASGYKETVVNSVGYVISTNDREKFIVLTSAAAADETFTLPAVDATTDRFKLAIYNASDYVLTIDAVGTADIWLNTSGQLDIDSGCLIELIYNSILDTWLPLGGNTGPILGGQDIGTTLFPTNSIYATDISADSLILTTSLTSPSIYSDEIHISSDGPLYFGDSNEVSLTYVSLATSLTANVAAGVSFLYRVNSVDFWSFEATGEILPALTNPKAELGSATNSLDFIYADNVSLPTAGYIYLGDADELIFGYTGTVINLLTSVEFHIGTTNANYISFYTNLTLAMRVVPDGTTEFYYNMYLVGTTPTIRFLDPSIMQIGVDSSGNGFINKSSSNAFYLKWGSADYFRYNSFGINIYKPMSFYDDINLNFGDSSDVQMYYWSAFNSLVLKTIGTTTIAIGIADELRWAFDASGNFIPYTTNSYDVGSPTAVARVVYTGALLGTGSLLRIGLSVFTYLDITSISEYLYLGNYYIDIVFETTGGLGKTYTLSIPEG